MGRSRGMVGGKEVCKDFARGACRKMNCALFHPPSTEQQLMEMEEAGKTAAWEARFETLREYGQSVFINAPTNVDVATLLDMYGFARFYAANPKIPPQSIVGHVLSDPDRAVTIRSLTPPYLHPHLHSFALSDGSNKAKVELLRGAIGAIIRETVHAVGGEEQWDAFARGFNSAVGEEPTTETSPPLLSYLNRM